MPIYRLIDVGERIPAANMTRVAASVNASSSVIFLQGVRKREDYTKKSFRRQRYKECA